MRQTSNSTRNATSHLGWSIDCPRCVSCGTKRHRRSFKNFCKRCYPLLYKIDRIDRGLYKRRGRHSSKRKNDHSFIRKKALLELSNFRDLEKPIISGASGQDIEHLLVTIAEVSGVNSDILDGVRYIFSGSIEPNNMSRVYEAILRIVESVKIRKARKLNAKRPFW